MILHLVKCEMCDNQFNFHPMQRIDREMPTEWFTVFRGKDIQGQEGWHFCSKGCLREWISAQLTANDVSLKRGGDWNSLSAKEKARVDDLRKRIGDMLIAETEAFYKVDPGLQIIWDFTLDALIRPNYDTLKKV